MNERGALRGTAVFVDRDGTLNHDHGYITSSSQLVLIHGVPEAIARLNRIGVKVIMVTNQSAIGRGLMTLHDLESVHERLAMLIRPSGAYMDAILYCPHHPRDGCDCRKPKTGLIDRAVKRFSLEVSQCFFVGDKHSDLAAAQQAAVPGVLVLTSPYGAEALKARDEGQLRIDHVADTFVQAVSWIEQQLMKRR